MSDGPKWHDREPWLGYKVLAALSLLALSLTTLVWLMSHYPAAQ